MPLACETGVPGVLVREFDSHAKGMSLQFGKCSTARYQLTATAQQREDQ